MSKEAYNIGREVGEAGRGRNSREGFWRGIRRTVETNCWQNGRVFVQETRARLPFLRRQRFSVPSLRLFAQWPWDCSSRMETPVSRNRFEDPRNQPTTDWLDKVKEKRRNKDGGTAVRAATGRKSGELKRLRLFYLSRRRTPPFLLHALAGISKVNYNTGSRVTRNRIGDPGKNFIVEGEGGASRSLLAGA